MSTGSGDTAYGGLRSFGQGRLGVAQIAEQLGFSDENAFVRAFRRWQGETPARYKAGFGR